MTLTGRIALLAGLALSASSLCQPAHAAVNLIVDGGFDYLQGSTGVNSQGAAASTATQVVSPNSNGGIALQGWTNAAYTFLFTPGSADTSGSNSTEYNNTLKLWGPNDGSANGLPSTSPSGGNYIASDGAYQTGTITQSVSGLTVGNLYSLSFYWAAAQQTGYTGTTTESWSVSFGSQTFSTQTVTNPSMGFTPWTLVTMNFLASSTTQTLSFLAAGTPNGNPPFSLLDGVALISAPEPSTWAVMLVGLGALGLGLRLRRGGNTTAA